MFSSQTSFENVSNKIMFFVPLNLTQIFTGVRNKYFHASPVYTKKSFHADSLNNRRTKAICEDNGKRQFRGRVPNWWCEFLQCQSLKGTFWKTELLCLKSYCLILA